jgi:glycine cleavage system H protein
MRGPWDHAAVATAAKVGPTRPNGVESLVADDEIPQQLRYTDRHEWVRDDDGELTVGITFFAQDELGDVVYVDLPPTGTQVRADEPFGEVESTKSVSDLYAPVDGEVVARNEELDERPELVNREPYGEGWMVRIRPSDASQFTGLLDADAYRTQVGA